MTLCVALKYDNGVVMLADTEEIDIKNAVRLSDSRKIFGSKNIIVATAGDSGQGQLLVNKLNEIEDNIHCLINELCSSKELSLETIIAKMKGKKMAVHPATSNEIALGEKDSKRRYQKDTLGFYFSNGNELHFDVADYSELVRAIMKEQDFKGSEILITGIDKKGKMVYEASSTFSLTEEKYYCATGLGRDCAKTLLDSLYTSDINEKEALLLAAYVGIKCHKNIMGINDRFNAAIIKKENGTIKRAELPEKEMSRLTALAYKIMPSFPYGSLGRK